MGKLVQLPKRGRTRTRSQSAGTGEVLLFTGVRYERGGGSSPLPDKPVGTASGGKGAIPGRVLMDAPSEGEYRK